MEQTVRARIAGTGRYLPEKILTNFDLEKMVDTSDEWIVSRTGIKQRRIASDEEATSDMAAKASLRALEKAGITPDLIDLIMVATVTPDMAFPATACLVQAAIGATNAAAMDLEAGCSGFVYGLSLAKGLIESGTYRHILVCGAETMSRILNWEDRSVCVLFGDGAGAALLAPSIDNSGILACSLGADGSGGNLLTQPAGGSRRPATQDTIDKREHVVHMQGGDVFKFAVRTMGQASLKAIDQAGLELDQIDLFIPHQANRNIIEASSRRLNLPLERVVINLDRYGNISSGSIPIALDEAIEQGRIQPGDIAVLTAFGGGLTWGSAVIRF